ncbi:hypothetical protein [Kozakia baliensis]|uniref:hypothetical protein n=1 Tax=Kozakia baliensis TaxID=153496 RepID=UPI000495389D|nr:hypothetical protein [Kozakia baliensis]
MTDVSQVALALAYRCAQVIYPDGLEHASITRRQTVIRRGWLLPSDLFSAQSIRDSVDYVTVTAAMDGYRSLPEPLGRPWRIGAMIAPTVGVSCVGNEARVSLMVGETPRGLIGLVWRQQGCVFATSSYAAGSSDTLETIAAGLAQGLPGAKANGDVISVSSGVIEGVNAGYGMSSRITRRQSQKIKISIWTTSAAARDALGARLDAALATQNWLPTLDGGAAQIDFEGEGDVDTMQMQALYRRDLVFRTVFDTLETQWSAQMMFGAGTLLADGNDISFGDVVTTSLGQSDVAVLAAEAAACAVAPAASVYLGLDIDAFGTVRSSAL